MSAPMQPDSKSAAADAKSQPVQTASFGTALLGFMITTTLTTSVMVLLSQA